MKVICPNCDAVLADLTVIIPHTESVHCGMCGHDFGLSLTVEEKAAAPAGSGSADDNKVLPPTGD